MRSVTESTSSSGIGDPEHRPDRSTNMSVRRDTSFGSQHGATAGQLDQPGKKPFSSTRAAVSKVGKYLKM